jgi:hypothetical protein
MGERGPVPKRTDVRRRVNKDPAGSVTKAPSGRTARGGATRAPLASRKWHPIAIRWYNALKASGQSRFYEPSDWMQAYVWAEILSGQLNALTNGEKVSAMMLATWDAASARLLVTEGDRRRMRLELQHGRPQADPDDDAGVASMDKWRKKLGGQ